MEEKKLFKSKKDKMIRGVCGGLAVYFGVDSTVIRLLMVLCGLFTGGILVLIFYVVASVIIPDEPEEYLDIYDE